jgi:hypothetical protein
VRKPDPQDQRVIAEIQTISGGFAGDGEISADRKAYAGQRKNWEVLAINQPLKSQKKKSSILGFLNEDYARVSVTSSLLQKGISDYIWITTWHYYIRDDKSCSEKYVYLFFFLKKRDDSLITHQSLSKIPPYK